MLKIASCHFGSGGGHLQNGIILWNFLKEKFRGGLHFSILTDSEFDAPIDDECLDLLYFPLEPEKTYGRDRETMLYQYLKHIDPDLIIVDSIWFPLHPILSDFRTKKVFFSCYLPEFWFNMPGDEVFGPVHFDPGEYNLLFAMEPHFSFDGSETLPPMINNLEGHIQPPEVIRSVLGVPGEKKLALVAHNGHEGEIEEIMKQADLDPAEYYLYSLSSLDERSRQIFPLSHYMSGVDLAIGGCGYHFFYETKFYDIPGLYFPQPRIGNEQHWRLEKNGSYNGPFNGGELFVEKVLSVL